MRKELLLPPGWMNIYLDKRNLDRALSPGISVFFPGDEVSRDFMPPRFTNGAWRDWQVPEGFKVATVRARDSVVAAHRKFGEVKLIAERETIDVHGDLYEAVNSLAISGDCVAEAAVLARAMAWNFDSPHSSQVDPLPFDHAVRRFLEMKLLEKHIQTVKDDFDGMCLRHWREALKLFRKWKQADTSEIGCNREYCAVERDCRRLAAPVLRQVRGIYNSYRDPAFVQRSVFTSLSREAKRRLRDK